jgi:hypothetical protein
MLAVAMKNPLLIFTTLFPVVCLIGGEALLFALAKPYDASIRKLLSRRIILNGFVLLIASNGRSAYYCTSQRPSMEQGALSPSGEGAR